MRQQSDIGAPYMPTEEEIAEEAAKLKAARLEAMLDKYYKPPERHGSPHRSTTRVVRPRKIGLEK